MLFNSMHFLLFFPIVAIFYYIFPHKMRWMWLLLASYYFYMAWNPRYALLMGTSTLITWMSGLLIDSTRKKKAKHGTQQNVWVKRRCKLWVALSFISNLAILFFFKYFYFAVDNINTILSALSITVLKPGFDVLLPVGISFYTFQALSYTMDVYRGDIYAEKNLAKYALFVSFFPQLVAGPIERSKNLLVQINERHRLEYDNVKNGLLIMLWGYFQKMVIADRAAILVDNVFNNYEQYVGFQIVVAAVLFAVQIYCDFAGYSSIAIGAAKVMGFRLMTNFRQPYYATSIRDFWSRWHISLSTWFKDYLYIPLGGSRKGTVKKYFNTMVTFLASGFWHGASWNFVVWGFLHGLYQIIGDVTRPFKEKLYKAIGVNTGVFSFTLGKALTTFVLVDFAWIFFRADNMGSALEIIRNMFSLFNIWIFFDGSIYTLGLDQKDFALLLFSIVILFVADYLKETMSVLDRLSEQNLVFRWMFYYIAIIFILVFGIYGTEYMQSQFIYFQF